jgi:sugar fermentation stimulation protein A
LDFRLSDGDSTCWVEVKSVTYAEEGLGKFPDAPTGRGRKHLLELANLVQRGERACVVFIVQREDALRFEPYEAIDPDFTDTLRKVHREGVEVHAFRCAVSLQSIVIVETIPVAL